MRLLLLGISLLFMVDASAQSSADTLEWALWGDTRAWSIRFQRSKMDTTLLHGGFEVRFKGTPVVEGQFIRNIKEGEWKHYDPVTGKLLAKGNYLAGLRHDNWDFFHLNGNKRATKRYYYGSQSGVSESFYDNKVRRARWLYDNDSTLARMEFFYLNGDTGIVREISTLSDQISIKHRSYHSRGPQFETYQYQLDRSHPLFKLKEDHFEDLFHFTYCSNPQSSSPIFPEAFQMEGSYRKYHPSGYMAEHLSYHADTLDKVIYIGDQWGNANDFSEMNGGNGTLIRYYTDNDTASVVQYKNGLPHGDARYYLENNRLYVMGDYSNGSPSATWRLVDREGRIERAVEFRSKHSGWFHQYRSNEKIEEWGPFTQGLRNGTWITADLYGDTALARTYELGRLQGKMKKFQRGVLFKEGSYLNNVTSGEWNTFNGRGKSTWYDNIEAPFEGESKPLPPQLNLVEGESGPGYSLLSKTYPRILADSRYGDLQEIGGEFFKVQIHTHDPGKLGSVDLTLVEEPSYGDARFVLTIEDTGHVIGLQCLNYTKRSFYLAALLILQQIPYLSPASIAGIPQQSTQVVTFFFEPI